MSNYSKGGRGKKAPYQTVHYRIPEPIKPTVEMLAEQYRQLANAQSANTVNEMLKNVQEAIFGSQAVGDKDDTNFTEADLEQTIEILQEALKLKANAGGKIKERIREALSFLR
jgi:hypothetical protein